MLPTHRIAFFFRILSVLLATSMALFQAPAHADIDADHTGITDNEVTFGSCICLHGPPQKRANKIIVGANSYFSYINDQGGINGRKIKLTVDDDAYDGEKAVECFDAHLKDKVFAGAFFLGSPPVVKYIRCGDAAKMPMIGFSNGYSGLFEFHPTIFSLRPSYLDEAAKQIDELYKHGITRVAVIYQLDAFGISVRAAVQKALHSHNLEPIAEATFERWTADIEPAYKIVKEKRPEAVIAVTFGPALVAAIKKRHEEKSNILFLTVSIGADYILDMGKDAVLADSVVVSQVTPPLDNRLPTVVLYDKLRNKYFPGSPPAVSGLEAFMNAMVIVEALKRAGRDLSRAKFIAALESLHDYDSGTLPTFKVNYSSSDHNGISPSSAYLSIMHGGKLKPMTESDWRALAKLAKTP